MPHFTLQITPSGPVVQALVGVSQARSEVIRNAGGKIPPAVPILALVDTGASCTCIDPAVFSQLQLTPTGSTPVLTPTTGATPIHCETFDVSLVVPGPTGAMPLVFPTVSATASKLFDGQGIHALIGRDILSRCLLIYDGQTQIIQLAY